MLKKKILLHCIHSEAISVKPHKGFYNSIVVKNRNDNRKYNGPELMFLFDSGLSRLINKLSLISNRNLLWPMSHNERVVIIKQKMISN